MPAVADAIKPEDIKPGDWVRYLRGMGSELSRIAVVEDVDDSPPRLHTSDGQVWTADVLEVRRG